MCYYFNFNVLAINNLNIVLEWTLSNAFEESSQ